MTPATIAISGIAGSFSEEAATKYLTENKIEANIVYAVTARDTFKSVSSGKTKLGLVPLENSNGGIVIETVYAAADYLYYIERIFEIDVQQNLLTLPDVSRKDVKKVASHHQALAQCKFYLRREWASAEMVEYADTALAAHDLYNGKLDRDTAVIASRTAAELYKLKILEPSIQDLKFNFTSFMVISKHTG